MTEYLQAVEELIWEDCSHVVQQMTKESSDYLSREKKRCSYHKETTKL